MPVPCRTVPAQEEVDCLISAHTIALLIDAGLDGETLKAITAAIESDVRNAVTVTERNAVTFSAASEPSAAALKMRKYREKTRAMREGNTEVTPGNSVTVTKVTSYNNNSSISLDSKEDLERKNIVRKVTRNGNSYSGEFQAFWKAYPTDPGMSKAEAFKAWGKLTAEDQELAVKAIPAFIAWCRKQGETYRIVHACRYLSQRRFEGFTTQAPPEPFKGTSNGQVFVKQGTDAFDAWNAVWKRTKGISPPTNQDGGWFFPSEYPQEAA